MTPNFAPKCVQFGTPRLTAQYVVAKFNATGYIIEIIINLASTHIQKERTSLICCWVVNLFVVSISLSLYLYIHLAVIIMHPFFGSFPPVAV